MVHAVGYSYEDIQGWAALMDSFFHKKSLIMGSIFYKKNP